MAMTSRQRVLTVFEHEQPDRVPAWCGSSPEFWEKAKKHLALDDEGLRVRFGDDFRRVFARSTEPQIHLPPDVTCRTPFGIDRHGYGYGQPVASPLAQATLEQVFEYSWPDPEKMDVSKIRAEAQRYEGKYAILGGDWSPFWHDVIDLIGMENLFLKMVDEPEVVKAVFEQVVDYYTSVSRNIFEAAGDAIDIFFIGNDFGSQTGPLLGEELFREFIIPHLARLILLGHSYGLKVMLHCCGGVRELLPAMIEIGLDGIHAIQPCCKGMDLAGLKKDFGDQIVFNGAIDSHHVLIDGTPQSVREETRKVLDIMKPDGGYIAGASHDYLLEETPVENVVAMFDAIREFGSYR
jgi:uroporphyrinogen decarboxylase